MLLFWPCLAVLLAISVVALDLPRFAFRQYWRLRLLRAIPSPANFAPVPWYLYWLLGHIQRVYKYDEEIVLRSIEEMNKPENVNINMAKIWLGPGIITLHISHSKLVGQLLKEPKSRMIYNMLIPWLGEGLLISEGEKWFRSRRLLTPAFHFEILKAYIPVYNSCVSVLLKKWCTSSRKKEPVLLFESFSSLSLDILLQCSFSFHSDCQSSKRKHPYVSACSELVHQCSERIMNPLYMVEWLYWMTPHGRKTAHLCNFVHRHAEKVIVQRRLDLQDVLKGDNVSNEDLLKEICKTRKYLDFLDILLTAVDSDGQGMSDEQIRNEVDTFMFEGHDTTTSALSWTLYLLAQHIEHQDKVREEVRNVLMGREWLEYDDLKLLQYTTWCVKESMRLYPPVYSFFRKTTDEIKLNEHTVPKGTTIAVETLLIHRNAHIWDRPNEFDPLRFQPANMERHDPYDYIPFSAGNRNCIGQHFALNELKVVVATIVSRFSLKVDESHRVEMVPRVILRTKDDIKILLEPVD